MVKSLSRRFSRKNSKSSLRRNSRRNTKRNSRRISRRNPKKISRRNSNKRNIRKTMKGGMENNLALRRQGALRRHAHKTTGHPHARTTWNKIKRENTGMVVPRPLVDKRIISTNRKKKKKKGQQACKRGKLIVITEQKLIMKIAINKNNVIRLF